MFENRISFLFVFREGDALWFARFRRSSKSDISQSFKMTQQHRTRCPTVFSHFEWKPLWYVKNYHCLCKISTYPQDKLI